MLVDLLQSADTGWTWVYAKDTQQVILKDSSARGNWIRTTELRARRFRDRGLTIFNRYPGDPRRWQWLSHTVDFEPMYFADPEQAAKAWDEKREADAIIDTAARSAWARLYPALRARYFQEAPDGREYFEFAELRSKMKSMAVAVERGELVDSAFADYQAGTLAYARKYPDAGGRMYAHLLVENAVGEQALKKHARKSLLQYLKAVQTIKNAELQLYAAAKEKLLLSGDTPIEMRFVTLRGDSIDLAKLRDKVVLVDFWNTTCSTCIDAFPKIRAMYEKYQGLGFEVIGVSVEPEDKKAKVLEILSKHSLPYPQVFIGGKDPFENEYVKKYQISGFPDMFLLDRKGRLVQNGYITEVELKEYLKRLLKLEIS